MKKIIILSLVFSVLITTPLAQSAPWSVALVGDAGVRGQVIQNLRESIVQQKVNQVILLGDNLYKANETYPTVWNPWKQMGFNFFAVAIGNHNKGYPAEMKYFGLPSEFYTVVQNGVRFIVLNSDNVKTAREQALFLESTLQKATEKQIYLVYHHPSVTVTDFHNWEEKAPLQNLVRAILIKHKSKITALLNGHDHVASLLDVSGIPLIVSGASFEQRKPKVINANDGMFFVKTLWNYKGGFYWVRMDFDGQGQRTCAQFIRVDRPEISISVQLYPKPIRPVADCKVYRHE